MSFVNGILNGIGDVLFLLFGWMHPIVLILVLAVLVAAGSLIVFRLTSNQEAIRRAKGPLKAHLTGIFLFRHDLRQVFRALGQALWRSLANLRFLLVPLAIMIVPLVLLFVQFDVRLGARGLDPGEAAVLRVKVKEGRSLDEVSLEAPEGLAVETPGVRVRDPGSGLHEVDFRIRARAEGRHAMRILHGAVVEEKRVTVGRGMAPLAWIRPGPSVIDLLLNPAEPGVPAESPIDSVELRYPAVTYPFLGIEWAWWVLFLIFMIVALFVLRGPLGVDF